MPDHARDATAYRAAAAAREIQQLLLDTEDITEFLDEVARYAARAVADGLSCGITLDQGSGPLTVASSDARARAMDEVQYGHHKGPCLTAMHTGETVHITDMATDTRWGDYRLDALAHGIAAALSISLEAGHDVAGALNLYATVPAVFGLEQQVHAESLAGEASRALRLAVRLTDQVRLTGQLQEAMASRSVIDQAMGIIMGQNRCTAAAAFEILRAASNHRNIKLRDVAGCIVTRVSQPPDPDLTAVSKPAPR